MSDDTLFDIAPAFIKEDERHGHITLAANPFGQCDAAFVDLGTRLHWWAYTPLHLDAAGARRLSQALATWADRAGGAA